MQSVFRTFFRRTAQGEYAFDHSVRSGNCWCESRSTSICKQAARHHAQRRNVNAEVAFDGDRLPPEAVTHEPTPGEAAVG